MEHQRQLSPQARAGAEAKTLPGRSAERQLAEAEFELNAARDGVGGNAKSRSTVR